MFQIVLVPGAEPTEFTQARAKRYKEAVVSEIDDSGEFVRIVAADEYVTWGEQAPVTKGKILEKPKLAEPKEVKNAAPKKKAVSKKKPAPKVKPENKQTAIPSDDSLENVDVSSI